MNLNKLLTVALCDHIEGSLAVRTYHWNIEGVNFTQYHDFFNEIYDMYAGEIDTLAEYIRIVSKSAEYVKVLSSDVNNNKTIDPELVVGDNIEAMIVQIDLINDTLIANFNSLFVEATKANEQGLADYCTSKLDALKKLGWKLKSISK